MALGYKFITVALSGIPETPHVTSSLAGGKRTLYQYEVDMVAERPTSNASYIEWILSGPEI